MKRNHLAMMTAWPMLSSVELVARVWHADLRHRPQQMSRMTLNWAFMVERVTGIEPASRAWEALILPLNYTRDAA